MDAILTVMSAVTFGLVSKAKNEPDKKVLDVDHDGNVTSKEAQEYKTKHPEANIEGVEVHDVVHSPRYAERLGKTGHIKPEHKSKPSALYTEQVTAQRQQENTTVPTLAS
jgi:LDH2 family malate/lactate/ureidoglycolate dehydrogenase